MVLFQSLRFSGKLHRTHCGLGFRLALGGLLLLTACRASRATQAPASGQNLEYSEMCDASAGVALGGPFFIVASDEDNILRVYSLERPGPPTSSHDMNTEIAPLTGKIEMDIEAAARLGDRAFWLTSHGRNREGKWRPDRNLLFATKLTTDSTEPSRYTVTLAGKPCRTLLDEMLAAPSLAPLGLQAAVHPELKREPRLAPKAEGLNIEGLAATPDGRLLIGLRNPLYQGKAILIPLENPGEVVDTGTAPRFGEPELLDLAGHGVRDMAWCPALHEYLIIAGGAQEGGKFSLWSWSGHTGDAPRREEKLKLGDLTPEGLIPVDDGRRILILSDDGTKMVDGEPCKTLTDPTRRSFRGVMLNPADFLAHNAASPSR